MSQTSHLAHKTCNAGSAKVALKGKELEAIHHELGKSWKLIKEQQIEKEYTFPDFATALAFTNKVGAIAEKAGHHPDILLSWGKVKISLSTHDIHGLSESDFIVAAKCDEIKK